MVLVTLRQKLQRFNTKKRSVGVINVNHNRYYQWHHSCVQLSHFVGFNRVNIHILLATNHACVSNHWFRRTCESRSWINLKILSLWSCCNNLIRYTTNWIKTKTINNLWQHLLTTYRHCSCCCGLSMACC